MTRDFDVKAWVTPKTVEEAVGFLKSDGARVIAGGTAVYELAKRGMIPNTDTLIDISELKLDFLREEPDTIHIGAATRLGWLLQQSIFSAPSLLGIRDALQKMKPVQVRNVATIGGAVCASIAFLDVPTSLLGHDAKVRIVGSSGERVVNLDNFWLDYLLPDLRKGELVTEIIIPKVQNHTGSSFTRLGRTASDYALVNVCSLLEFDSASSCVSSRIALGGIANTPVRLRKAEEALKGMKPQKEDISLVLEKTNDLTPVSSIQGSSSYKKQISKILIRDSIKLSTERALA